MIDSTPGIGKARQPSDVSDVDRLLMELRDFDDDKRVHAAKALGAVHGDPHVVVALVGRLKDRSAQVRRHAIEALVSTGDQSVCASVTALLLDPNDQVRAKAAWALGEMRCADSAMQLVEAVDDASTEVAQWAGTSLGKLGNPKAAQALIDKLCRYDTLREPQRSSRVSALAKMGAMVILPLLRSFSNYKPEHIYTWRGLDLQVQALGNDSGIEDRVNVLLKLDSQTIDTVAKWYDSKEGLGGRITAIQYLAQHTDPRAQQVLCKACTEEPSPEVRWMAIAGVEKAAASQASSQALLTVLQKDNEAPLRWRAAKALGTQKNQNTVPGLCRAVGQEVHSRVAQQVILSLGLIGDPRAIPTLADFLINDDRAPEKRRCAAEALGGIRSPDCVRPLLSALGADGNPEVRIAAAKSLEQLGFQEAIQPLKIVAGGRDEDQRVIDAAKTALAALRR